MFYYKMVSFPIFILFFAELAFCTGEIIKVENKKHILCITDEEKSAMYVEPPVVEDSKNDSILIEKDGFWKDWVLKNSKDVVVPQVLDKRWENFETVYTDHIYFPSVVYLSYSVSKNTTVNDLIPTNKRRKRQGELTGWSHHSNRGTIDKTNWNNFLPLQMNVTSQGNSYWRIHDYNLRWADRSSGSMPVVPISPDDASCVVLYAYICSHCTLSIRVGGNIFLLRGSMKDEWVSRRFFVDRPMNMTLSRSTTRLAWTEGQWAIDIRRCPPRRSDKIIYEASLEKDVESGANRTCNFLSGPAHRTIGPDGNIFNCDKGLLGRECDISCEELLGSDLKYCQQHQICDNTLLNHPKCLCAWGYQGPSCHEECPAGNKGLSCNPVGE